MVASFEKYPTAKVAFTDKSLAIFAPSVSAQVTQMKDAGVQFVGTCIDLNESFALGKELKRQGVQAILGLPNA